MIKLLASAGLLVLALAASGCARSTEPGPGSASAARAAPSTVPSPSSSLGPAGANWPAFTSRQGGYRLRYPPGWRVKESAGTGGPVLSLLPPRGTGVTVLVTFTPPPEAGAARLPNSRCQPVRVGGLAGTRCLDTTSMVVTTILQGQERWYALSASLRRPAGPRGAYDRVLASFRPI